MTNGKDRGPLNIFQSFLKGDAGVALALMGLLLVFLSPVWIGNDTIFFRDISALIYPVKFFIANAYHEGFVPYWNPSSFHGSPLMAALYPGVFYPVNLIFLSENITTAFNWFYIIHFAILTLFVFLLVRLWGLSRGAAFAASITALLSGYFLAATLNSTQFLGGIWLPAIFFCFQKYLVEKKFRYFFAAVFFQACQILAGLPEACVATDIMLALHCLFFRNSETTFADLRRRILALGAMAILAIGSTAFQLIPTYYMFQQSLRSGGMDFETHTKWSLKPAEMATLLVPRDYTRFLSQTGGEMFEFNPSIYMGVFPLAIVFGLWRFRKNTGLAFWAMMALAGIFLSLGKYNPLYYLVYSWIPLVQFFRIPEKYFLISAFSLVFLTAYGVDALLRLKRDQKEVPWDWVLIPLVLSAAALCIGWWKPLRNPWFSFTTLFVLCVLSFLFFKGKLETYLFKPLLIGLILFDLGLQNYMVLPLIDRSYYDDMPKLAKQIQEDGDLARVYTGNLEGPVNNLRFPPGPNIVLKQIAAKESLFPDFGTLYGATYAGGLTGAALELESSWLWNEVFKKSSSQRRKRILQRSNVKYWVTWEETESGMGEKFFDTLHMKYLEKVLPRAFLVPKARKGELGKMLNTYYDESFDPLKEVLISEPISHIPSNDFEGRVRQIKYRTNEVRLKTEQNASGFLVLLDSFYPGWTVNVDGRPEKILRANHFFRAVQLDAGSHEIRFSFEPEGLGTGTWVSLGVAFFLVGMGRFKNLFGLKESGGAMRNGLQR